MLDFLPVRCMSAFWLKQVLYIDVFESVAKIIRWLTQMRKIRKSEAEWREILNGDAFNVCRLKGTERPFSGKYCDHKEIGIYNCICCEAPLFSSEHKYESGCGWPSFWKTLESTGVDCVPDGSLSMTRTEVVCSSCESHLGHVFEDGPKPTGLRYCINSLSLGFYRKD